MTNDKTVKSPCKFAIKDELGDLICGNEYSENLADFCSVCSNYVPDYQRSDNVSDEKCQKGVI